MVNSGLLKPQFAEVNAMTYSVPFLVTVAPDTILPLGPPAGLVDSTRAAGK